ncbi:carbon-nitrogen hydrolase family protein [Actinoplanes sp. CA-142083]|uniref:carbon-nitrogen hydrolase family protein n=1 Tax=Actinoplanes sp. CA-142083 TaxID=3239903 RepID=UPI003D8DFAC6
MRIGACQTPEILGDVDASLRVIREFADAGDVDLLLFPECFLQGYLVTEQHVREHALELDSAVLTELAGIRPTVVLGMIEREGDRYFNTAAVVRDGRVVGRYRKTFLVPGESVFTAGDDYPVFECGGMLFGINICYDAQFPAAAAGVAANGGQVLLLPAQNMMRRDKAFEWQHRHNAIRAERARETGMWLASADVTGERGDDRIGLGPTCFLNPAGEVIAQVPAGRSGMVVAEI